MFPVSFIDIQLRFLINCQISQLVENDQQSFFISAVFSLGSFELAPNKLRAPQLSHPFMGLMWKQSSAVVSIQRDSWNLPDERREHIGQDSTPAYQTWQAGSTFQSCPHLGDFLGGWCVQSCVCCSRTVLNVKYYWAPF